MPEPSHYFRLTCLTPVHIGSGERYVPGIDYVMHKGKAWLLDSSRVMEALYRRGQLQLDPGDLKAKIENLLARANVEEYALCQAFGSLPDRLDHIRASIRAGNGLPIIPGSSLKGAIRTLLFVQRSTANRAERAINPVLANQFSSAVDRARPRAKFAARPLEDAIFGSSLKPGLGLKSSDAKADLMRMCLATDTTLALSSIQIAMTAAVGTNRNTTVAIECLAPNSTALSRLSLNTSYVESMFAEHLPGWNEVAELSRAHALHLLGTDLRYFERSKQDTVRDCTAVTERLKALQGQIQDAQPDTIFLRLGWGSGWRTMTGDLLSDDQRRHLLEKSNQLGPKSRKVIIANASRDAPATDVLGWISMRPISAAEAMRAESEPVPRRLPPIENAPLPVSHATQSGVDEFLQVVATLQSKDWGRLAEFYRRALSDPALRETRVAALGSKIASVWKGDKRRLREARGRFPELAEHLKSA
jgi:CRISPR-associated protein Csm5